MKLTLSLGAMPELQNLSRNDRQRVWSTAYQKVVFSPFGLLGFVILTCFSILGHMVRSALGSADLWVRLTPYFSLAVGMFLVTIMCVNRARLLMPAIIEEMNLKK